MNYICKGRSNYFQVTDEERYKVLFECILGEKKDDFTKEVDGKIFHGFGISNYIDFSLPASENETVKECIARGETLYDEFGDEVPVSDYDKQDALYNSDGKRVFRRPDEEGGIGLFIKELQKILPDGECFAFEEIGQGFRYLTGIAWVATNKNADWFCMSDFIAEKAKEWTGKSTACCY